ncbi:MAG: hypothetical protein ACE363_12400 [Alphaproteobacteria bacterium]
MGEEPANPFAAHAVADLEDPLQQRAQRLVDQLVQDAVGGGLHARLQRIERELTILEERDIQLRQVVPENVRRGANLV